MNSEKIEKLVKELCEKRVKYKSYDSSIHDTNLIQTGNETILEQIIRSHVLDARDERLGQLEAKVFVYEEMIAKSSFAPMLIEKDVIVEEIQTYQREMLFTQRQIETLAGKVFQITGEGEVMNLFNDLLCINAG
jgi:predicted S18 family serine protease